MKKIKWVNFLHIYQPSWQEKGIVDKVVKESYQFLVESFKTNKTFRGTINIAGTLIETLSSLGYEELLQDIVTLYDQDRIELTGSSHFHAFLPQLPENEIHRQIELQEQILQKTFRSFKRRGFFLPEMAYSPQVGKIVHDLGYKWIILDSISAHGEPDPTIKHLDRRTGLTVIFRNRKLSSAYPPEEIHNMLNKNTDEEGIVITATDGELYGHFHKDWQQHLKRILASDKIESMQVSEYIDQLTVRHPIRLRSSSWQTKTKHIRRNNPYTVWHNKSNPIHRRLWQLATLAMQEVAQHKNDSNYIWARHHLDRGLASCSWWWASEIKTSPFAPIAWSPDEIHKGATELIKSIRSLQTLSAKGKIRAERVYLALMDNVWTNHWNKYGK